jgi:hypothetical protein
MAGVLVMAGPSVVIVVHGVNREMTSSWSRPLELIAVS